MAAILPKTVTHAELYEQDYFLWLEQLPASLLVKLLQKFEKGYINLEISKH